MNECVLILVVSPAVEDQMVEWLLGQEGISGFSSIPIRGHSTEHAHLSVVEQVTGRQRQVMFHVETSQDRGKSLLDAMHQDFSGVGIRYWLVPLLAAGRIG